MHKPVTRDDLEAVGLTQRELARRLDVSTKQIWRYFKGTSGSPKLHKRIYECVTERGIRVPIVELDDRRDVVGEIRKDQVHKHNLPHRSVILVVRCESSTVLACQRHSMQRAGNRLDLFGEHERVEDDNDPKKTVQRLLREELRALEDVAADYLEQFGAEFEAEPYSETDATADPFNQHEWSTLYGLNLEEMGKRFRDMKGQVFDETDSGEEVPLTLEVRDIEQLRTLFGTNRIADGMGKVLREIVRETELGRRVEAFIQGQ